jgi:glutamine synthetase
LKGSLKPGSEYYCSVGGLNTIGRDVAVAHYKACLHAGVNVTSFSGAESPSKWKFKIGPLKGFQASDHLWMARYILQRVAEDFGVVASLDSKITEENVDLKKNGALICFRTSKVLSGFDKEW